MRDAHRLPPLLPRLALGRCLALATLMAGCNGGGGDATKPSGGPAKPSAPPSATGPGTPVPPFQGATPKGAYVDANAEPGRYGGTFSLAVPGNPKTFNPILGTADSTGGIIQGSVFATCMEFDNAAQLEVPGLCEKYERSTDGLTYTFTLREGLLWSDGQPLTTDDFAFTYNAILDPKVPSAARDLFKQGNDAKGADQFPVLEKVDDRVFRMRLKEVNVTFSYALSAVYVLPHHKWDDAYSRGEFNQTMSLQTPPEEIVSSGPFRIKSFVNETRVVLERNPYYWKVDKVGTRLPYLDHVVFELVPDLNVALLKFRDGETDVYEIRAEDVELIERDQKRGNYTVQDLGPAFNTNYFMFNLDDGLGKDGKPFVDPIKMKWFKDKRFRKAISHAIDRDAIVRVVFQGCAQPLWSYTSPANRAWYNPDITKYPYSLDKARELLTQAGFVQRDNALYDGTGKRVSFTMVTNSENSTRIAILNLLKEDFTKLGIDVTVRPVPFNDLVTALNDTRNFEAIVLGWGSSVPPDPSQMANVLLSSGRSHNWHPNQKTPATPWEQRINDLFQKNTTSPDMAVRKKAYNEIEAILSDELPEIGLAVIDDHAAGRNNLGNFKPSALRPRTHWNIDELYFKTPKAH